ncbi:glycosyltransferase [Hymenobacter sp.]|uniref:glycosyltransferase n=1 Tax=Hymenobacter sp. TaxID=1898978 RepID=UPI0039C88528
MFNTVCSLGHSLAAQGTEVHYLLHDDEHSPEDRARYAPLPLHTYTAKGPSNLAYSPDLATQLRAIKPDIVHTQGIWMYFSYVNNKYCAQTHTPYIISPHGMLDPWQLRQSFSKDLKKKLVRLLYEDAHLRRAACIQALCESEYEAIRAFGLKNPVAIIPNGVVLPAAAAATAPPKPSAQGQRKTLLYLSRLHHKKGLAELLRGWALTAPAQHDWQLTIAGTTPDEAYLQSLVSLTQELGVADSVQFVGGQFGNAKDSRYRQADAFILPSFSEGLPMAVLEAWSYELPVIMTSFCNIPEGFAHQAALPIEPTPASIAAGIRQLMACPEAERQRMGQRGYQLVSQSFTWEKVARDTAELYQWVKGQAPQPAFVRTT